jgi:Ca2+-binding RTX toxin-like protein
LSGAPATTEGGTGNDTFVIDDQSDVVRELNNGGNDTVVTDAFSVNLASYPNIENATLTGDDNFSLRGTNLANRLIGNEGDNDLTGLKAKDLLLGNDGADTFVYTAINQSTVKGSGRDTIADFTRADGDLIDLSAIDAKGGSGNQAFTWIGKQNFDDKKGELHYVVQNGNAIVQGDTTGDGKADFAILVKGVTSLNAGDFDL